MAALPPPWSKDLSSNDVQHCPSSPQRTARRNTEVVKVVDSSLRRLISAQGAFNRRRTMSKPYIEQIEESESFYSGIEEGLCEADQKPDAKLDFDSIPIRRTRIATFSFHLVTAILVTTFAYRLGTTQAAKVAFIGGAASLFFATLLLLIQYHNLTERRHMFFRNHAIKSSAIVSSLFPERVQGRLLENSMATLENDSSNHRGDKDVASVLQERNSEKAREPPKNRLMQFLRESSPDPKLVEELTPKESKPIADYFPNCTVMVSGKTGCK